MPEDVHQLRSSTHRACVTHSTDEPYDVAHQYARLLVVARNPSSSPAAASTAAPVHTDVTSLASLAHAASLSKNSASLTSERVPRPPGTRRCREVSRHDTQRSPRPRHPGCSSQALERSRPIRQKTPAAAFRVGLTGQKRRVARNRRRGQSRRAGEIRPGHLTARAVGRIWVCHCAENHPVARDSFRRLSTALKNAMSATRTRTPPANKVCRPTAAPPSESEEQCGRAGRERPQGKQSTGEISGGLRELPNSLILCHTGKMTCHRVPLSTSRRGCRIRTTSTAARITGIARRFGRYSLISS